MRRKTIAVLCLSLLAALVLVAAGCGGGSKNSAATTEAATTEAVTTEAATTTEAVTTEAATTTEAVTTEPNLSGIASASNCKDLADLSTKLSTAFSGTGAAPDIKKEAQILEEIAAKAPSDIKGDFKTMADFVSKVADIYGNMKPGQVPDAATLQKLQGLQTEAQKVTAASQNIGAWVTKNCHA